MLLSRAWFNFSSFGIFIIPVLVALYLGIVNVVVGINPYARIVGATRKGKNISKDMYPPPLLGPSGFLGSYGQWSRPSRAKRTNDSFVFCDTRQPFELLRSVLPNPGIKTQTRTREQFCPPLHARQRTPGPDDRFFIFFFAFAFPRLSRQLAANNFFPPFLTRHQRVPLCKFSIFLSRDYREIFALENYFRI